MSRHVEPFVPPAAAQREENVHYAGIRADCLKAAKVGRTPRISVDDLRKAFENHPDERKEFSRLMQESRQREADAIARRDDAQHLRLETKRVLGEWDEQRRREAEAEARRRLSG
jgi:Skp family chaperone for outer membrane proteins